MTTIDPETAAQYGLTVNSNQGTYGRGLAYSIGKKLEVTEVYKSHTEANDGGRPVLVTETITEVTTEQQGKTKPFDSDSPRLPKNG